MIEQILKNIQHNENVRPYLTYTFGLSETDEQEISKYIKLDSKLTNKAFNAETEEEITELIKEDYKKFEEIVKNKDEFPLTIKTENGIISFRKSFLLRLSLWDTEVNSLTDFVSFPSKMFSLLGVIWKWTDQQHASACWDRSDLEKIYNWFVNKNIFSTQDYLDEKSLNKYIDIYRQKFDFDNYQNPNYLLKNADAIEVSFDWEKVHLNEWHHKIAALYKFVQVFLNNDFNHSRLKLILSQLSFSIKSHGPNGFVRINELV